MAPGNLPKLAESHDVNIAVFASEETFCEREKTGTTNSKSVILDKLITSFSSKLIPPKEPGLARNPPPELIIFPGTNLRLFVPKLSNWFWIYFFSPSPKAINKTTDKTPIKIPKDVKNVFALLREKSKKADFIMKET